MVNINLSQKNCLLKLFVLYGSLLDIESIVFVKNINVGRL